MSEVKTRKQEALELLEQVEQGAELTHEVNVLTALQAGYRIVFNDDGYYDIMNPSGGFHFRSNFGSLEGHKIEGFLPKYATSVDNCLTLPIPGMMWDSMQVNPKYTGCKIRRFEYGNSVEVSKGEGITLSIAMLRAWWRMQN